MIRVFHRTHHADAILREGFRDGRYVVPGIGPMQGIFVSADWPLDVNEGADGDVVLALEIPAELFERYEWVEVDKGYREALIPARDLNGFPLVRLTDDEIDELSIAKWSGWNEGFGHELGTAEAPDA